MQHHSPYKHVRMLIPSAFMMFIIGPDTGNLSIHVTISLTSCSLLLANSICSHLFGLFIKFLLLDLLLKAKTEKLGPSKAAELVASRSLQRVQLLFTHVIPHSVVVPF